MGISPASKAPYILGLDIGVASIGWSRILCDPVDGFKPLGFPSECAAGAHIFEPGTDGGKGGLDAISRGADTSRNKARRDARLMRRQIWRRARRKRKLLRALIRHGLLPDSAGLAALAGKSAREVGGDLRLPLEIDAYLKTLDKHLAKTWLAGKSHADHQRMPYLIRAAAATEPIERFAFGRALYHLAQRRGFLSNRRSEAKKKDEDTSIVKQAIGELAEKIAAFAAAGGKPTLGAYLASLNPDEERLRGRWTSRRMYEEEFDQIWAAQASGFSLSDTSRKEIREILFHQRPLKDQSNLVGRCSLLPDERRCPVAHRTYQQFRVLQTVNNIMIDEPGSGPRPPSAIERTTVLDALMKSGDLTFAKARTLLKLKKGTAFNLERGDETKLAGHRTDAKLRAAVGSEFESLPDEDRDRMVEDLRSFRLPDKLIALAERPLPPAGTRKRRDGRTPQYGWGLSTEAATKFAAIDLEDGYAPLSLEAIRRLMPRLEAGVPFATARREIFPESFKSTRPVDLLPPVLEAMDDLRNPSVLRALTEARKLVNEMIRRFGKPALIRIELARDIKAPRKVRERIVKNMRAREKARSAIVADIQKHTGISNPSREDIERVLLAEECGWICPYTGRSIGWNTLLGREPQFDIEHIWPRSRSLDDSLLNKTLCYHEENRSRKRGNTPREAYGGNPTRFAEIIGRLRLFKSDPFTKSEKIARFEAENIPSDFTNRHLSDTRYIASAAADYFALLFGGRVESGADGAPGARRIDVCTGGLTAWLRSGWGIGGLLGEGPDKNRADHRHHAVDAVVIALSDARAVNILARAASAADQIGKRRAFETIDPPWPGFRDQVEAMIDRVVVSHRQSRKVSGQFHNDSIYSEPINGQSRIRKELRKLSVSEIRDGKVVDPRALAAIRAKLAELGTPEPTSQELTKIFTDPAHAPIVNGHDGEMVRLRKVRVYADQGRTIGTAEKGNIRQVSPASNHHTVIIATLDGSGRDAKWEDRPVQLLDAYQRQMQKQPIVSRDAGKHERFVFSLSPGDFVEMKVPGDATKTALFRVASISGGDNELKLHNDARTSDELKKSKARVRVSAEKLRKLRARKVRISYLGEVLNAGG